SENLLKKAAAQNYAPAYYALYKVINSDEKLLLKAAEQGYAPAQVTMAINARNRIGRIDFEEMEKWLRLAAEQGHFGAQYYLGDFHYKGRGGLQKNYELAYKWYYLSSLSGYSHAEERVKELEKKDGFLGLWGNSDISPKQAERLQKEARAMFDEIEKRKKRNRRRNMVFHAAIKKQ
ncbi:MAG: sel1 repeat family protein, partial [Synergistaceae bacterium]|nr:sel1 repeat family protein [Synergistaceae bacterium]